MALANKVIQNLKNYLNLLPEQERDNYLKIFLLNLLKISKPDDYQNLIKFINEKTEEFKAIEKNISNNKIMGEITDYLQVDLQNKLKYYYANIFYPTLSKAICSIFKDNAQVPEAYINAAQELLTIDLPSTAADQEIKQHIAFCDEINSLFKEKNRKVEVKNLINECLYSSIQIETSSIIEQKKLLIKLTNLVVILKKSSNYDSEFLNKAEMINDINKMINTVYKYIKTNEINQNNEQELDDIKRGLYQNQLYDFTYKIPNGVWYLLRSGGNLLQDKQITSSGVSNHKTTDLEIFNVYPLMDQGGLRCTAAVSKDTDQDPVEVQINFFGTIDFLSKCADLDKGGPGEHTIKQHENELLKQVNSLLHQIALENPNKKLKLRVAGHSLGGALAKQFVHILQRAIAVNQEEPKAIINKIINELPKFTPDEFDQKKLIELEMKLKKDEVNYKPLKALKHIDSISLYVLGSPGVGAQTDQDATLLTYYYHPDFLKVYHHFHKADVITKFGDCDFLAGQHGPPNVTNNKAIEFDIELTKDDFENAGSLPFPKITKKVMAAHGKKIYEEPQFSTTIMNAKESEKLTEKFQFSNARKNTHLAAFYIAKQAAKYNCIRNRFNFLRSFPAHNLDRPHAISKEKEEKAATVIQKSFKSYLAKKPR